MPLLDHFHPPLHGLRRWEGFHHAWAVSLAQQLNDGVLPPDYFAEPEISMGPELEIDVAAMELDGAKSDGGVATATWAPPRAQVFRKGGFRQPGHLRSARVPGSGRRRIAGRD